MSQAWFVVALIFYSISSASLAEAILNYPNSKGLRVEAPQPKGYTTVRNMGINSVFQWGKEPEKGAIFWIQLSIYEVPRKEPNPFKTMEPLKWAINLVPYNTGRIVSAAEALTNDTRAIDVVYDHVIDVENEKWRNLTFARSFLVDQRLVVVECISGMRHEYGNPPPISKLTELRSKHIPDCNAVLDGLRVELAQPAARSTIDQKPFKAASPTNESRSSTDQLRRSTNAVSALKLDQEIFLASPQIDSPCKAIPGIHTVHDGVEYLLKKYGDKAALVRASNSIESTGQRLAMIELPTENASALFFLADGTLKQCSDLFDSIKSRIENSSLQMDHSEKWVRVGSTLDGARTDYVDASSIIKGEGGLIRLTIKQTYDPPEISAKGNEIAEARVSLVLNCAESASAVSLLNQYDKRNSLVEHTKAEKLEWVVTSETDSSLRGTLFRVNCKSPSMRQ